MSFLNRLLLMCCLLYCTPLAAQSRHEITTGPGATGKLIQAQTFVFKVQNATPFNGQVQQLAPGSYYVSVSRDSIVCYLPYFGRVWTLPTDVTHLGIDFTSTGFQYTTRQRKREEEVLITFSDRRDVRELRFSIYDDGNATLRVRSTSRDQMSYDGTIVPRGKR